MITIKELCSNKTDYSTTRWAFCVTIIFDMIIIALSMIVNVLCIIFNRQLDSNFMSSVATLLGILTSLTSVPKILQGFEKHEGKEEGK